MKRCSLSMLFACLLACWIADSSLLGAQTPADPSAAASPVVNFAPGAEYADQARIFQGIPGIERASNGRLWATWYGGGVTEDRHNYVVLVTSGDDGQTWSTVAVIDPDRDGPNRAFDPCLWHDPQGRLWLFWSQRIDGSVKPPAIPPAELLAMTTENSGDASARWSRPRWIASGVMMNKPTVVSNGSWLMPVANWFQKGSAGVVCSTDQGVTWSLLGRANVPEGRDCDEHMIVERNDGSLWMLVRTRYGIGESTSTDGGRTWSEVTPSKLNHPTSRSCIRRLRSGRLLLVKHSPPQDARVRSHLTATVSDDDGRSWKGGLLLDERLGVSYPDVVESPEGNLYLIYDFSRYHDKKIFMAVFTEEDVAAAKLVSKQSRLRVLINQATGVAPKTTKPNG